ncbi:MAG: alkaline phosphatase family protein [Thermoleophilaceae bacterium]
MSARANRLTRRTLLAGGATAAGALAVGRWPAGAHTRPPSHPPFEHVVVLMMENRSFDHFLGWLPHSDGRQAGLIYKDKAGAKHSTHALAPDWQGCGRADPDHSYEGGRVEYNDGRCDGWLRAGSNDDFSIGYYRRQDLAFLGQAVPQWTTFSRYFAAILAETYPNRIYQHAGQTDRLHNSTTISTLPTIWDRLAAAGLQGRYYFSDVPFLALWGPKYIPISRPYATFEADCAAGTLPQVSFIDPRFEDEDSGTSGDDHPHADIRNGEAFMARVHNAVTTSPAWSKTVLLINFDEWGGFFDHVPPPRAPIPSADVVAGNKDGRRGFRVPTLLVSPWARRGYIGSTVYDHTSVLRMIEERWKLPPLTVRDATANNLAGALTGTANVRAPHYQVPAGPFGGPCGPSLPGLPVSPESEWTALRTLALASGWPL